MPQGQIEHVNLTVSDPDRSASLLEDLLGWSERWRGPSQMGGWTIHLGTTSTYLAIYTTGESVERFAKGVPLNHVGFVVDDLDAAERTVTSHGLTPFNRGRYEPGPDSFYFFDWDGIEFEVVSYA